MNNILGIHNNTVHAWVKAGLATSDNKRPMLILGLDLVAFLQARRVKNKQACKPGEIYCVRCRVPKFTAGDIADYSSVTTKVATLKAISPACNSIINRRVSLANPGQVRKKMDISFSQAMQHIAEQMFCMCKALLAIQERGRRAREARESEEVKE